MHRAVGADDIPVIAASPTQRGSWCPQHSATFFDVSSKRRLGDGNGVFVISGWNAPYALVDAAARDDSAGSSRMLEPVRRCHRLQLFIGRYEVADEMHLRGRCIAQCIWRVETALVLRCGPLDI